MYKSLIKNCTAWNPSKLSCMLQFLRYQNYKCQPNGRRWLFANNIIYFVQSVEAKTQKRLSMPVFMIQVIACLFCTTPLWPGSNGCQKYEMLHLAAGYTWNWSPSTSWSQSSSDKQITAEATMFPLSSNIFVGCKPLDSKRGVPLFIPSIEWLQAAWESKPVHPTSLFCGSKVFVASGLEISHVRLSLKGLSSIPV